MDASDEKNYTFQKVKETQKDLKDTDGFIWCADCHAVKHINSIPDTLLINILWLF